MGTSVNSIKINFTEKSMSGIKLNKFWYGSIPEIKEIEEITVLETIRNFFKVALDIFTLPFKIILAIFGGSNDEENK